MGIQMQIWVPIFYWSYSIHFFFAQGIVMMRPEGSSPNQKLSLAVELVQDQSERGVMNSLVTTVAQRNVGMCPNDHQYNSQEPNSK